MLAATLCPTAVRLQPELAALAILDAALLASHAALLAEHPVAAGPLALPSAEPAPALIPIAALLIKRSAELRRLLARYQRVIDDCHQPHQDERDERQGMFPF